MGLFGGCTPGKFVQQKTITMQYKRPPFHSTAAMSAVRSAAATIRQLATPLVKNESTLDLYRFRPVKSVIEINAGGTFPAVQPFLKAEKLINARAIALGYAVTDLIGDITGVPGGFMGHYVHHDIYTGTDGKTFEVHGDIRQAYNNLGAAQSILGIPVTDETGTPDGIGRFNHFKNGSIYWTPKTGPAALWAKVRDCWAQNGWERGALGYPISNQHRMIPIPATDPIVEWCTFENGVIAADPKTCNIAPAASMSEATLKNLIGSRIRDQFQANPNNVALRSGSEILGVTDYKYEYPHGYLSRAVGFRFHGFHDNGLATDTDFFIDIWLRFMLCAPIGFSEPNTKTLVAVMDYLRVDFENFVRIEEIRKGVEDGIRNSFYSTDPDHPELPEGSVVVDVVDTGANLRTGVISLLDVLLDAGGNL